MNNIFSNEKLVDLEIYIGKQLREKRLKRGFTLANVASKMGISHQQVQKYEQAQSRVSVVTLYKFAILYDMDISKFFENLMKKFLYKTCEPTKIINTSGILQLTILLVEDDPGEEELIRKSLESFGDLRILCLRDGTQALEFLKYKTICVDFPRPNIIFLDLGLPKMDGATVLKEIKRDKDTKGIPAIVVTNNVDYEMMSNMYRLGASGYICKSFDFDTFRKNLVDCVRYWKQTVVLPSRDK